MIISTNLFYFCIIFNSSKYKYVRSTVRTQTVLRTGTVGMQFSEESVGFRSGNEILLTTEHSSCCIEFSEGTTYRRRKKYVKGWTSIQLRHVTRYSTPAKGLVDFGLWLLAFMAFMAFITFITFITMTLTAFIAFFACKRRPCDS